MSQYLLHNKMVVYFCLAVGVNLLVKILGISYNPIALDEPFSIYHSQFPIGHIYRTLIDGNNPPMYEFFLHYWISVVGTDVFWVRLPSVIFSSLAVGFWFMAAMHCMNVWYAVGCTVLFTFSTEFVYFSHEARAYAMLLMVLGISTYLLVRLWNGEQRKLIVFSAAFFSALSVYIHYLAALPITLMAMISLVWVIKNRNKELMGYLLLTLLFIIPIGILFLERVRVISSVSVWGVKPLWTQLYGFLNIFLNGRETLVVLLICILIALGFFLKKKGTPGSLLDSRYLFIWATLFFCAYLGMYIISYKHPIFIERYVQVVIPFFFLLLGSLFSALLGKTNKGKFIGLVVLFVFCLQADIYPGNNRNPQQVADLSKEFLQKNEGVVYLTPNWFDLNFAYYFDREIFTYTYDKFLDSLNKRKIIPVNDSIISDRKSAKVLLVDSGEYFVFGSNLTLNRLLKDYELEKTDSVDKQTTLYYLNIKQD